MCRPYTKNDTNLHCEANVQQLLSFQTWASERGARILKISSINMDIFLVSSGKSQILPILSSVEKFWKNAPLAPLEKIFPTHMVQILFFRFLEFRFLQLDKFSCNANKNNCVIMPVFMEQSAFWNGSTTAGTSWTVNNSTG